MCSGASDQSLPLKWHGGLKLQAVDSRVKGKESRVGEGNDRTMDDIRTPRRSTPSSTRRWGRRRRRTSQYVEESDQAQRRIGGEIRRRSRGLLRNAG